MSSNPVNENHVGQTRTPEDPATPNQASSQPEDIVIGLLSKCVLESAALILPQKYGISITHLSTQLGAPSRRNDLSACVSLAGASNLMTLAVHVSHEFAFAIGEADLGTKPTVMDDGLRGILGEMVSSIAAEVKQRMDIGGLLLGQPHVVTGDNSNCGLSQDMTPNALGFVSEFGAFQIEFGCCSPGESTAHARA